MLTDFGRPRSSQRDVYLVITNASWCCGELNICFILFWKKKVNLVKNAEKCRGLRELCVFTEKNFTRKTGFILTNSTSNLFSSQYFSKRCSTMEFHFEGLLELRLVTVLTHGWYCCFFHVELNVVIFCIFRLRLRMTNCAVREEIWISP